MTPFLRFNSSILCERHVTYELDNKKRVKDLSIGFSLSEGKYSFCSDIQHHNTGLKACSVNGLT